MFLKSIGFKFLIFVGQSLGFKTIKSLDLLHVDGSLDRSLVKSHISFSFSAGYIYPGIYSSSANITY